MKTIGVIGAGTMGIGVAISLLQKKISVRLIDIDKDQIGRAKTEIENKNCHLFNVKRNRY